MSHPQGSTYRSQFGVQTTGATSNAARADIAEYIGGYNAGRAHSSLADVTPNEHCFAQLPTIMAMAA